MQNDKNFLGTAPIGKLLLKLSIPTVIAQLINMLYNVVDRIYIGHIPGEGSLALTGVGVCMPIIMIVTAFAALISSGGAPRASICTVLLAGCNTSSESNEEQPLKVYSFSGENKYISVSNGVIILDGKDEICYGGDLKVMSDDFSDITTYSTTIYINGSEKEILLSNGVDNHTGGTIDVSGNIGKISGDILRDSDDKLTDNLWFELKTTNLSGEENTYQLQLKTTEITKEVKK